MSETVNHALADLHGRLHGYQEAREYYHGNHDLQFASDAFRRAFGGLLKELSYNRCASVVDAIADRIQIDAWEQPGDNTDRNELAEDIWTANRGDWLAGVVHVEALCAGDAYVIVWPDREGQPRIRPQRADMVTVLYSDDDPDEVEVGVKVWRVQRGEFRKHWRVTVYERDVISRFVTKGPTDTMPKKVDGMVPYDDGDPAVMTNPYGIVPVIPFPNNQLLPGEHGISELRDVIPLQNGLNKSLSDMVVAAEYVAYPQRYAVGVETTMDPVTGREVEQFEPGVDRIWGVNDPAAKFGEFPAADMEKFIAVQTNWDEMISRVSRIPTFWLGMRGDFPSGEALKTAEAPFVAKIRDRQVLFGASWQQAMRLALTISGTADTEVEPIFAPPVARSDLEFWQLAQMKKAAGVPDKQIWKEAGYTDEQITEFEAAAQEKAEQQAEMFSRSFNTGAI